MTDHEQHPAGPVLDELGVTLDLDPQDRVTEVMVLAKVTNLDTGRVALVIADNGLDWIAQRGLHSAAQHVLDDTEPVDCDDGD